MDDVVVLHLCTCSVFCFVGESVVASEHEMADGDLVVACLRVDGLTVIKDIHPEVLWGHSFDLGELLAGLEELDVHGCTGVVSWANGDLLLENDSILRGHISVDVLERLALHDFLKGESLLVAQGVNNELALACVVRHHTLDDEAVAARPIGLELELSQVHLVEADDVVGLREVVTIRTSSTAINNLRPHVVEQVPVSWRVDLNMNNGVLVSLTFWCWDIELIFPKVLIFSSLLRQILRCDLLGDKRLLLLQVVRFRYNCNLPQLTCNP